MTSLLRFLIVTICVSVPANADTPRVFCEVGECGGARRSYAYELDAPGFAVTEFVVATRDIDAARYTHVTTPPGWQFAVEPVGMDHTDGIYTPHGGFSPGPGGELTAGRVRWWTDDETKAVASFTFAFDHPWYAEDALWQLATGLPGSPAGQTFTASWEAPVGEGAGPIHGPTGPHSNLRLGPESFVQADGADLFVPGYSVPSLVPWDGDALPDLIVGEGGAGNPGKIRVYRNIGTATAPAFGDFVYVQSGDGDFEVPGENCMGAFPRVVYWDADARKDLLVGLPTGNIRLLLNVGTDAAPVFDSGTLLQVGDPGAKVDIDVWARAAPTVVDWNNDGKKDLVVGSVDGLIYLFINAGPDDAPDFRTMLFVESLAGPLFVPSTRASPVVLDLDGDGKKDILAGNRAGQLIFYPNGGSDAAPTFSLYSLVRADGAQIDLPELPRSRPFVCDWNNDGAYDVLVGSGDGKVRLYQGRASAGDFDADGDVDLDDYAVLPDCLDGPDQPVDPACRPADLDGDEDIDLVDFSLFQAAFTG